MVAAVVGVRFILEIATVLGLVGGVVMRKPLAIKVGLAVLGAAIALAWSRYGAPQSPDALTGPTRLGLELAVFGAGAVGLLVLYGKTVGRLYAAVAVADLVCLHALGLS